MQLLKLIGWVMLFLLAGLLGTAAIFTGASAIIHGKNPVRLPFAHVLTDLWGEGFVSARGTVTIDNDRSAFPIQTTKIECYRDKGSCTVATAQVAFGDTLDVDLSTYEVSLWNASTINFLEDRHCVHYVYTIDRASKRVIGTRASKPN